MEKGKLFDLVAVILIAGTGLATAYVTFGLLQSQASAEGQGYSVGGAIAGALITMSLLASVYAQFRKSSTELDELRNRNEELQHKLIRRAPRPPGFDTEVDERQRIVLAAPRNWAPRGGVIFDFDLAQTEMKQDDLVPARFWLSYSLVTTITDPAEMFYENYRDSVGSATQVATHTSEYIYVGGEQGAAKSLKIIAHEYALATKHIDPLTGSVSYSWNAVPKDDYDAELKKENDKRRDGVSATQGTANDSSSTTGLTPGLAHRPVMLSRMRVLCYHNALQRIFQFDFIDDLKDFANSSTTFNQLLDSVRFLS
jgi:hypothetical protein